MIRLGIPKEITAGERRVALEPKVVARFVDTGFEVHVEAGAGKESFFSDAAYKEAGAVIVDTARATYDADIIVKVRKPALKDAAHEVDLMREGAVLVGLLEPLTSPDLIKRLADRKVTAFAMETIPRISRAQKMDALSSQSNIAGYKAALIAADSIAKFFPMLMTAAGTIAPSKALILGAGVAGLQAIATCRRLGAVVEAFDVRPAVKEEVQSLGAKFIEVDVGTDTQDAGGYARELTEDAKNRQREVISERAMAADVVITTALIPGKPAPLLITEDTVKGMKEGSVIVDLAAETGGNCELTEPGKVVVVHGVAIHGPLNLPSELSINASQMYSKNVEGLIILLVEEGELRLDFEDEIVSGSCITHAGEIVNERVKEAVGIGA